MAESRWIKILGIATACLAIAAVFAIAYYRHGWDGVFRVANLIYSISITAAGAMYAKSKKFYFFVKKLQYKLFKSSSFWHISARFYFDFKDTRSDSEILAQVLAAIKQSFGKIDVKPARANETCNLIFYITDPPSLAFNLALRSNEIFLGSELPITVPSSQELRIQRKLEKLAEHLSRALLPTKMICNLLITFDNRNKNPYLGLFVERVPIDLIESFNVGFKLPGSSRCRIKADKECVSIEAEDFSDLFKGVSGVLSLSLMPTEIQNETL